MFSLILATEAASSNPPGDDFQTLAYVLVGATMVIAAIATLIVTPAGEKH